MNKKQAIILISAFVLILAIVFVMYKQNNKPAKINDTNIDQSQLNDLTDSDKSVNNVADNSINNLKNKNMNDIKEFSYEVLVPGSGQTAMAGNNVTVAYKGTFIDGKVFDQGEFPFTVGVGQVVPGFDKGVLGMQIGETRKIYIPSDMGYGARGAGAAIPPNTDLIFEVTLKSIQ